MGPPPFGLRPIANAYCGFILQHLWFLRFDDYQIVLIVALLGFLSGIAFLGSGSKRETVNRYCPPWLYCALLICFLLIARLPTFLPGSLNPDEAMFLAGAIKLRHYPVFWRSFDGATSGPLNYYALTLLNLAGLPLDFATARLMNVLCIGGAIAVVYRIARLFMADWIARLAPLPALAAAMAFRGANFLHYSSECVSVLLIALATWLLFMDGQSDRASWVRGGGIGLIAALLPLAKLQAAPMALILAAGGMAQGFFCNQPGKWRRALSVLAGLAAGAVALGLFVFGFQVFHDFWQSYVVMNFLQANMYPPVSLAAFLRYCLDPDVRWYEAGILIWLTYLFASHRGIVRALSFLDLLAFSILAASFYAIYQPRTGYQHYLLFLIFPLALLGARALALSLIGSASAGQSVRMAGLFVLLTLVLPVIFRGKELRTDYQSEAWMVRGHQRDQCDACKLVSQFAMPGGLVTVWGWKPEI